MKFIEIMIKNVDQAIKNNEGNAAASIKSCSAYEKALVANVSKL